MSWEDDLDAALEASQKMVRAAPKSGVSTHGYLANESKLVPAGLLGLPVETAANVIKLIQAGVGRAYGAATDKVPPGILDTDWQPPGGIASMAKLMGYQHLDAPSNEAELGGDILKGVGNALAMGQVMPGAAAATLPVKAAIAASGAMGGAGAFAARQAFPGSPAAEITGSMIGGAVPTVSPVINVGKVAVSLARKKSRDDIIDKATTEYGPIIEAKMREKIIRDMADDLRGEPLAEKNITTAGDLAKQVPGATLDLGQASQTGSSVQRIKGAYRSSPKTVVEKEVIDRQNRLALQSALPREQQGAQDPFNRMVREHEAGLAGARGRLTEADEAALDIAGQARRMSVDEAEAAGATLKGIRGAEKTKADQTVRGLSEAVDKAAGDQQFKVGGIAQVAEDALGVPIAKFDPTNAPRVATKIKQIMGEEAAEKAVGIKDLRGLMEAVNQDIADVANSSSGVDRRQFRALTQIKRSINQAIEDSGNSGVKQAFDTFNKHYATEYAPRFLRGENIRQTIKNDIGVEVVPDEKVLGSYLKPGASAPMRRFLDLYGKRPDAMKLMEGAVYDRYAKEVMTPTGEIGPAKHTKFMFNYGSQIARIDKAGGQIGKTLGGRATAMREINAKRAAMREQIDTMNDDAFVGILKDRFGAHDTDTVMRQIAGDPRKIRELASRMSPAEAKGMVNWFANDLEGAISGADYGAMGASLNRKLSNPSYVAAHKIALEKAYGSKEAAAHLQRVDAIRQIAGRMDATELDPFIGMRGEAAAVNMDALQKAAGFTARSVFNLGRAMIAGRNSPEDTAFVLATQFGTHRLQKMSNEITVKLLMDPNLSTEVLAAMRTQPKDGPGWLKSGWGITKAGAGRLANHLLDNALPATAAAIAPAAKDIADRSQAEQ